jgi:hypothetical protein
LVLFQSFELHQFRRSCGLPGLTHCPVVVRPHQRRARFERPGSRSIEVRGLIDLPIVGRQPAAGSFGLACQRDPILFDRGQFNLYAYVHNNPVSKRDPLGLESAEGYTPEELEELIRALTEELNDPATS